MIFLMNQNSFDENDSNWRRSVFTLAVFSGKKYVSFVTDGGFSDCGEVDGGDSVAVRRVR